MGHFDDALHDAEKTIACKREWHKGWARKAAALDAKGMIEEALSAARQALSLELGNPEYRKLANTLRSKLDASPPPTTKKDNITKALPHPVHTTNGSDSHARCDPHPHPAYDSACVSGCVYQRYDPQEGPGDNLLVLLHGLGDTPERYLALGKQLQLPSTSVVALRAPHPLGRGSPLEGHMDGYEWFPSFENDGQPIKPSRTDSRRLDGLNRS
eukprot:CAMPEP_0179412624 /NCGR_PEP_ID=MMETSP0799-20121207/4581_1 /TAXON_ID=46947 /ORGANISM="Geminigera cryophila, Strain CCMP2564" /LENGTH=212 /DNA_ID=CAMNT_0021184875 /DNA_START=47 /DNA_END=682 /DNA_ORIENTATION=-